MNKIMTSILFCALFASFAAAQFAAARASVSTTPAHPTTKDSITYNFYDSSACCCAEFVSPSVSVLDTMVYLNFSENTAPCQQCRCSQAGAGNAFKGGPLAAGRYAIYSAQSLYCPPGTACPAIAMQPVRIGQVTVTADTTTYPQFRLTPANPTPQDSVSLWFVKGLVQSCGPIAYVTSFSISDDQIVCVMAPCPAGFTIKVTYRQLLVGIVCIPPLPPPAEYGPHFAFGKLPAGFYTVRDSTDGNKTLFEFSVGQNASTRSPVSMPRSAPGISQIAYFGGSLHFALDRPQRLSISAYTPGGREIAGISRSGFFPAGINGIPVRSGTLAGGMIFVRIKGTGISEIARIKID